MNKDKPIAFNHIEGLSFAEYERNTKELIEKLKKDSMLERFVQNNHLPKDRIHESPWLIQSWLKEINKCKGCKRIEDCKQSEKGFFPDLVYDQEFHINFKQCPFAKKEYELRKHLKNYLVSDLSENLETVSFKEIDMENEVEEYLLVLEKAMEYSQEEKSVYLYGTMGSGKTYLAACACNAQARKGKKVAFIHYPSFCKRVSYFAGSEEVELEIQRIRRADFLVIDDIGAEMVSEYNRDAILLPLLNYRFDQKKTTWITSNFDFAVLENHLTSSNRGISAEAKAMRIVERIASGTSVLALTTKDRRKAL
ncbi:MAG: ATP-binding protein [Solobacterium sp.]|nr:ATP-binding protein [Solobacterium sp.]